MSVLAHVCITTTLALGALLGATSTRADDVRDLPRRLSDTGLYVDGSMTCIRPENIAYSPQYPLWSDGATKRRWLHLSAGESIDATRPDAWQFPPGTRLWKEFSLGRPIETRFIEHRKDGSWQYATYIWNAEGTDATLAPPEGREALSIPGAPNGRYTILSESDCRACHEGAAVPVLGISALQLSADRDPLAPHAERAHARVLDVRDLVARGLLRNLPPALIETPARIAASSDVERAALGYLHGNCGHCHNRDGSPPPVDLSLAQHTSASTASVLRSMVDAVSRYRAPGIRGAVVLVAPGRPDASVLTTRMRSRNPQVQMPPLGTQLIDPEGLALIERWITSLKDTTEEPHP